MAAIPRSDKKPVETYIVDHKLHPLILSRMRHGTCRYLYSGTCIILLIADEGPRTETSDSIKLLIHATTS